jgi:hypothetical protein
MSTVTVWTGASGVNQITSLVFDGTYIYAGHSLSPTKIVQVDPSAMATVATWTGASGENYCNALAFDGTYIFIATFATPSKVIRKIMRGIDETGT